MQTPADHSNSSVLAQHKCIFPEKLGNILGTTSLAVAIRFSCCMPDDDCISIKRDSDIFVVEY